MVEQTGAAIGASTSPRGGALVFVSYSREDAEWRRLFEQVLRPLVRERRLDVWSDERTLVGEQWRPQLRQAIGAARAALLLVSPAFLASDFIMEQELPELIERGVQLVFVLVRPCLFAKVGTLADVQWAHDPRRDGPVANASDPLGQIVRVCERLLELVAPQERGEPAGAAVGSDAGGAAAGPQAPTLSPGGRMGELHDVPVLPPAFVVREELAGVREALLGEGEGAVGITGRAMGLFGQGGIGKTVLAAALAADEGVLRRFPDGAFWVTVGEHGDPVKAQIALLARLGIAHGELRAASRGLELLRAALADRRCLLIVDDVWSAGAAQAFRATGPRGRVLYTTRDAAVLQAVGARVERVEVLPVAAARELLAGLTGARADSLPAQADAVLAATGRVALALALVGAAIGRGGRSWPDVVAELARGGETFLDHPYANTFKAMQVAVAALDQGLAGAYRSLAAFPEDTPIPLAALERYWRRVFDSSPAQVRARVEQLAERELLALADDAIAFHDLQRDFLLLHVEDLAVLHTDVLGAYRGLLPGDHDAWSQLPPEEPYIWEHLLYHLRGAVDPSAIAAVVSDLAYLAVRSFRGGPYAAETDLRHAAELHPDHPAIAWLLRLFTQSGHVFAGHTRLGDLAATLASRTHDAPAPAASDTLERLLPAVYLSPRWGLPSAPAPLQRVLEGHTGWVRAVAFSSDGQRLASAGDDGTVRLWDAASGHQTATLKGHTGWVNAVAFSHEGERLASAGADGTVRLWDAASGHPTATLEGHTAAVLTVAFSPDGQRLASAGDDGTVRLWDAASGPPTATLKRHTAGVNAVAFSPDGQRLASAGDDGTVRLWDAASGRPTTTLKASTGRVLAVAFSPDGQRLARAGADGTVRLWDAASGHRTATLKGHTAAVLAVAFSPDGQRLASASDDGTVRLWDAASGHPTATLEGHTAAVLTVAFSPDGQRLASAGYDGTVRLWDAASGHRTTTLEAHIDRVRAVAFSPDGQRLASAGDDGTVRLWDAASGHLTTTLKAHTDRVRAVAFSPDGQRLASAGDDGTVRLWDAASGPPTATLKRHTAGVNAVAFSPDGQRLASAGDDGTVRLWDAASGHQTATLKAHADRVLAVAFSPDGQRLASAGYDRTVRLWDAASGPPTATLKRHTAGVNAVAFSPDGQRLASADNDRTVRLWDAASGRPTTTLKAHTDRVRAVAFSPDSQRLASAGDDRTVRLWDAQHCAPISLLNVAAPVAALAWGLSGIGVAAHTAVIHLNIICRAPA